MRKKYTLYNSIMGLVNRIVTIIFVFFVRHYFVQFLNNEHLGLEGLFSNILGLFSLVDLGLGSAIAFNLYEPLHNKNRDMVNAIMRLYRILYILIGVTIFLLSLAFSPFVRFLIKDGTIQDSSVRTYFITYAIGVATTYFFSYKRTLIFASQKNYIVLIIDTVVKIILSVVQIILLHQYKSYFIYLIISIVFNLMGNIVISFALERQHLYDRRAKTSLPKEYKNKIVKHVKALAVTNIAWQGIASTDNIIISSLVGISDLAKNAGYSTITASISSIVSSLLGGASASIGDLLVEKNIAKSKQYFDRYCFIYSAVSSYAALGLFFVSKNVIEIWVGKNLVFNTVPVFLISLNLLLSLNFRPLADYQNYSGLFVYYKPFSIVAVLINLVTSIVFAQFIGISGVFLGTTITYSFMIIVVVSNLHKRLFEMSTCKFWIKQFRNFIPFLCSFAMISLFECIVDISSLMVIIQLCIRVAFVTIIFCTNFILFLNKEDEYSFFLSMIKERISKKVS